MKVILLSDVKNIGKKGDVKEVSDGYARNFLIRNHLALEATRKSMEILSQQKADAAARNEQLKQEALETKEKLEKLTLSFKVKASSEGKMFGSVSNGKIAEMLEKDYGIKVDKKKFADSGNLTTLGVHEVGVKLFEGVTARIKVSIESL
ncbi:MAG: 50S ribosomal protein L9 [Erysipelotrichaceae bacterium]|nr:50S ribosomal protein L9 [Erysipelotrichaceae bacterium]